jgi:DNA-binding phage protein
MLLTRITAIQDGVENDDPDYLDGFRAAVSAAFDYNLAVIEADEEETPPVPAALLVRARIAARNSVGLDAVVSRYVAGSALLDHITFDAIDHPTWLAGGQWQRLLRVRGCALQHLLYAITAEYETERSKRSESREAKLTAKVRALLNCEPVDTTSLDYDFDGHHLGVAAHGEGAAVEVRNFAKAFGCRLLLVQPNEDSVWAWLGGRHSIDKPRLADTIQSHWQTDVPLAFGEEVTGEAGWRQTHRQAKAALPIALRGPDAVVQYSDVCLLASMLQDDLLTASLRATYLQPLLDSRNGKAHLQTLQTYFACNRNAASTAAALGVSRQTINNRLRAIEARLGRPLSSCAPALEACLLLETQSG